MNYSLGNMLSRGGALNPNGLSLDLAFAADKTLTARKGPTPTFTRASTATFVGSDGLIQSAAINAPRFDHDPDTLACKGLLIEESRTNLCLRSEEFNNAIWQGAIQTPTISTDFAVSPNGTQTAERLQWTVVNGRLQQIFSPSALTDYTFSVWLKSNTGSNQIVQLFLYFGSGGTNYGETKTVTPNWQRFTVTASSTVVAAGAVFQIRSAQSTTDILAWGAQLELGSFPTSYIPTTTTALTRSADVCSITGGDFTSFSSTVGFTALCNFSLLATATAGAMAPIAVNQSAANGVFLYKGITSSDLTVYHVSTNTSIGSVTANFTYKAAMAYDGDSVVGVLSGGSVSVETGSTALSFTGMTIGSNRSSAHQMSGHIARIQYFKKRLPNAKLQSLTAP
jgi:hypothetical protein